MKLPSAVWQQIMALTFAPGDERKRHGVRLTRQQYYPIKDMLAGKDICLFRGNICVVKPVGDHLCPDCRIVFRLFRVTLDDIASGICEGCLRDPGYRALCRCVMLTRLVGWNVRYNVYCDVDDEIIPINLT